jgi:hypothetical protein
LAKAPFQKKILATDLSVYLKNFSGKLLNPKIFPKLLFGNSSHQLLLPITLPTTLPTATSGDPKTHHDSRLREKIKHEPGRMWVSPCPRANTHSNDSDPSAHYVSIARMGANRTLTMTEI